MILGYVGIVALATTLIIGEFAWAAPRCQGKQMRRLVGLGLPLLTAVAALVALVALALHVALAG